MAEPKTQATKASVKAFLDAVPDERRRRDAQAVDALMREVTGEKPVLWGASIVGYGRYTQLNARGKGVDWPIVGFSPRKAALVLYVMPGFDRYDALLKTLGKYTIGKSCLYLKKLEDVDAAVLKQLVTGSVARMRETYPASK
jgi:hypothetical protein